MIDVKKTEGNARRRQIPKGLSTLAGLICIRDPLSGSGWVVYVGALLPVTSSLMVYRSESGLAGLLVRSVS